MNVGISLFLIRPVLSSCFIYLGVDIPYFRSIFSSDCSELSILNSDLFFLHIHVLVPVFDLFLFWCPLPFLSVQYCIFNFPFLLLVSLFHSMFLKPPCVLQNIQSLLPHHSTSLVTAYTLQPHNFIPSSLISYPLTIVLSFVWWRVKRCFVCIQKFQLISGAARG